jgi:GTPase SAR1 family protein
VGLVCPYCYESFPEREILFRCTGRTSRFGKVCARKVDEVLLSRTGRRDAVPPFFGGDGRQTTAICPHCQDESTYRICPACHSQLPLHFGKLRSRMIALIGARESGKTVFMTVLVHELTNRVGARFNAAVVGCDDNTRSRFSEDYEKRLYEERQLLGATRSAATQAGGLVSPLVFRFTTQQNGLFGRPRTVRSLFSFFDTAGEDLRTQQSVDLNVRYLNSADGIILLLDPLQMAGARELASGSARLPLVAESPLNVLSRVTELLQARQGSPSSRIQKPTAVVFSKLDALWHGFARGSPLQRLPEDIPGFDRRDSLDVHDHVRALLHDWGGGQIDQVLQHYYARYRYFAVSALGQSPTQDNRVTTIQPYRVADPFLWLLAEFGVIPAARG